MAKGSKTSGVAIGAHFSIAGGFKQAFENAIEIGASSMQIFAKSPRSFKYRKIKKEEVEEVRGFKDRDKIKYIVIHCSYLLNFGKPLTDNSYPLSSLAEDLYNADQLEANGVVLHLGKYLELGEKKAEDCFVKNIKKVLTKTKKLKANIILENTAGQGTEMGFRLDDLARIYKKLGRHSRVKFCFDTAHAFAAGYEVGDKKFIKELDKHLGLKNIACIHFNDSKKALGSRVDRHEDIGKGAIGDKKLKSFAENILSAAKRSIPFILETPQGFDIYEKQIKKVRRWTKILPNGR